MYCVNCGVKLADTEKKCPLCETEVYHPTIKQGEARKLYPEGKMPEKKSGFNVIAVAGVIIFVLAMIICFFADIQRNAKLDWFGFVGGALVSGYVIFALPLWFKRPNPVIFVPCDFAVSILYLWYINFAVGGDWFLSFVFPAVGGMALIICTVITLIRYVKRGRLYILGGASVLLGAFMLLVEYLLDMTFKLSFVGWSIYPLIALVALGGIMIYLAIDAVARETVARKLFF